MRKRRWTPARQRRCGADAVPHPYRPPQYKRAVLLRAGFRTREWRRHRAGRLAPRLPMHDSTVANCGTFGSLTVAGAVSALPSWTEGAPTSHLNPHTRVCGYRKLNYRRSIGALASICKHWGLAPGYGACLRRRSFASDSTSGTCPSGTCPSGTGTLRCQSPAAWARRLAPGPRIPPVLEHDIRQRMPLIPALHLQHRRRIELGHVPDAQHGDRPAPRRHAAQRA